MSLRHGMTHGDAIAYLRVQGDLWAMETDNMLANLPYGRLRTVFSAVYWLRCTMAAIPALHSEIS